MRRTLIVTGDTIIAYLLCGCNVRSAIDGDELYKALRSAQLFRQERIITMLHAAHDILKPLVEDPSRGLQVLMVDRGI